MTDSPHALAVAGEASPQALAAPENVTGLLQLAIERQVPVEVLERLVALQERVTERNAKVAFAEARAAFQEQCPEIPRTATANIVTKGGARFSYKYAPLDTIARVIRPALKANGLSYSFDVSMGDGCMIVLCILRHVFGHSECASFPVPIDKEARMSAAQSHGAALTYGRRQALIAALGLTTADEDKDGGDTRHGSAEKITAQQAAELSALVDEVVKNQAKFLAWLEVERIEDLPASEYRRAHNELQRRKGQQ